MGKAKQHPKKYVLSVRVSDEEFQMFTLISSICQSSISDMMREGLEALADSYRQQLAAQ